MVEIKGLEKFSPRDYPGVISATVFLGSCNFRCPYCHNAELVLNPDDLPTFPMGYITDFLDSRKDWLEGICITGGEPLLHPDLVDFLSLLKERELSVKLDTNGSFPSQLEALIEKKLVDSIAMDVKAPLERYEEVTRTKVDRGKIRKSIDIIMGSGVEYVFRLTAVPGLIDEEGMTEIGRMLEGAKAFQIQQFVPENTLDPAFELLEPFKRDGIRALGRCVEQFFSEVRFEEA
ncbi:MAG: anaerobic ribonucleoside-triphosphate reductase activating protein [Candidatus Aminicenantes bacterium]|nr:MAG: anaerobic ribonucleoside-triphosphate reductase activating protein [Candidatus Aminicenantes bacterium]